VTTLHHRLFSFTLEDQLSVLRALVGMAWVSALAMLLLELWIRATNERAWPSVGGFSLTYNLVLLEFAANSLCLNVLLLQRDWYERAPRESIARLRWLLIAVVIWFGIHYFAAFHVFGSLSGPLLPLLPVLVLAALVVFPGKWGWFTAAYLLAGHAAVALMEQYQLILNRVLLAGFYVYTERMTVSGVFLLLLALALAMLLGTLLRRRLAETGSAVHRASCIDSFTGLYHEDFLSQRLERELGRARRQASPTALVVLEIEGLAERMLPRRHAAANDLLQQAAGTLIDCTRLTMDTPATSEVARTSFTVLLPDTPGEKARVVANRMQQSLTPLLAAAGAGIRCRIGIAAATRAAGIDGERLRAVAQEALERARGAGVDLEVLEASA
jgi:GGDEF domain-containing protein